MKIEGTNEKRIQIMRIFVSEKKNLKRREIN